MKNITTTISICGLRLFVDADYYPGEDASQNSPGEGSTIELNEVMTVEG